MESGASLSTSVQLTTAAAIHWLHVQILIPAESAVHVQTGTKATESTARNLLCATPTTAAAQTMLLVLNLMDRYD